jgi:hypothetical protein
VTLCKHGAQTGAGYECSACVTTPAAKSDATLAVLEEFEALSREAGEYGDTCEEYGAVRAYSSTTVRGPALERVEVAWAAVTARLDRIEQYLRSEQR